MNKQLFISEKNIRLIIGMLLGFFVLTQSVYDVPSNTADSQEQSAEDTANDLPDNVITQSKALTSSSQIELGFESYLLDERSFDEEQQGKVIPHELIAPRIHKAIRILFSRVIAPNAP